jgi:hypothetical protein
LPYLYIIIIFFITINKKIKWESGQTPKKAV